MNKNLYTAYIIIQYAIFIVKNWGILVLLLNYFFFRPINQFFNSLIKSIIKKIDIIKINKPIVRRTNNDEKISAYNKPITQKPIAVSFNTSSKKINKINKQYIINKITPNILTPPYAYGVASTIAQLSAFSSVNSNCDICIALVLVSRYATVTTAMT